MTSVWPEVQRRLRTACRGTELQPTTQKTIGLRSDRSNAGQGPQRALKATRSRASQGSTRKVKKAYEVTEGAMGRAPELRPRRGGNPIDGEDKHGTIHESSFAWSATVRGAVSTRIAPKERRRAIEGGAGGRDTVAPAPQQGATGKKVLRQPGRKRRGLASNMRGWE